MVKRFPSEAVDVSPLARPLEFQFSGRKATNRFMKAAMTERLSSWDIRDLKKRGVPSDQLVNVYRRWGEGDWGVILSGNIMIDYDQLEAPGNPIVARDNQFPSDDGSSQGGDERFRQFQRLAAEAKRHGALLVGQVSHPGRQVYGSVNPHPISASDVQLVKHGMGPGMTFGKPRAATDADIAAVVDGFAHAARYLQAAGFDGIQLHGAHGYLLAQFLSATTNRRTDRYGGSLENRARIVTEIGAAVRAATRPDFILAIKMNSVEFQDDGITPEEAREVAALLESHRFDFVELSGGSYEAWAFEHKRESTRKREAFFIEFAELIAPALKGRTRTYVTGGLKTSRAMVAALDVVDGVGLGRPATQEPQLPKEILEGKANAAIQPLLNQDDFGPTIAAAGVQIRQVGDDHRPIDLTNQENVEAFMKDLMAWREAQQSDEEGTKYGHAAMVSSVAVPYGTPLA